MDEVIDFIRRRFPQDSNWLSGNCYFFAIILKDRFKGRVCYDPIDGHFVFQSIKGKYYDWSGERQFKTLPLDWEEYKQIDNQHWHRIMHDCRR